MKSFLFGAAVLAGSAACAQGAWGFKYQFLDTGTGQWSSNAAATVIVGGNSVQFRVVAYVDPGWMVNNAVGGPGIAVAFGRLTGQEQMTSFGTDAGDMVLSHTRGELVSSGPAYLTSSYSGGTMYFGTSAATSFARKVLTSQGLEAYCPSSGGVPQLEWIVRSGAIQIGGAVGLVRSLTFSNSVRTQALWYRDLLVNGVQDVEMGTPSGPPVGRMGGGTLEDVPATDIAGTVTVTIVDVPAPGAMGSFAVVALFACRRRRNLVGGDG